MDYVKSYWHFLRLNWKSWAVDPAAGWGWRRLTLKNPGNLKLRLTGVRKSVSTDSRCSNSLKGSRFQGLQEAFG